MNSPVRQAWLVFQREVSQIAVVHAPTAAALDQRVKPEWDSQRPWRAAWQRDEDAVPLTAPAAEFCFSLNLAAERQKQCLRRLTSPQTTLEACFATSQFE